MNEFPTFTWGKDARIEVRGLNVFIMLFDPELIRKIAFEHRRYAGPNLIKRTKGNEYDPNGMYELMGVSYPHDLPLVFGDSHHSFVLYVL